MFKNLIFNLDDNLFDYTNAYNKSMEQIFKCLNKTLNIDYTTLNDKFKIIKKKYQNNIKNQASSKNKFIQLKKFTELLNLSYDNLIDLYDVYLTEFYKNLKLFNNVIDFLELCKILKINCYILTNNLCYEQVNILNKLQIMNYFKKIYTSEEFGSEKPDTKIFNSILVENNININDVAMIGDSFKNDIEGVNLINIYAFWFNNTDLNFNFYNNYCHFTCYSHLFNFFKTYYLEVEKLIKLSKFCGERFDLVQAGGGNISFKLRKFMFIKSSGCLLSDIDINKNYVGVDYKNILNNIFNINDNDNDNDNDKKNIENQSKNIVDDSIYFLKKFKPSIETTMHILTKKYTVHINPLQFLKICGKKNCLEILNKNFNNFCFIDYRTPGIDIALELKKVYNNEDVIFMKNNGIVITDNNIENIYRLIGNIINNLEKITNSEFTKYQFTNYLSSLMNEITSSSTISYLFNDKEIYELFNKKIDLSPFFHDKLIYCGIHKIILSKNKSYDLMEIKRYKEKYNEIPKIFIYNNNIYSNSNNIKKCMEIESLFKSHLICYDKDNDILDNNENNYLNNSDCKFEI